MTKGAKNTELVDNKTLQQKLSVELSKSKELKPVNPVDANSVNQIVTTELNKSVIISSLNFPAIKQYPPNALKYKLLISINKTIMFIGYDVKDIDFLYKGVFDYIRTDAKNLSIEELDIAFKLGALGDYGEWHGLSARTFCKWIKTYMKETRRKAMIEKMKIKKPEPELTPEQKYNTNKSWLTSILEMYEKFLQSKEIDFNFYDYQNRLFNFMVALNIISFSKKKELRYFEKAKNSFRTKKNVDELDIKLKVKKLILSDWFKNAKIQNKDLAQIIEEKNGWDYLKNFDN